MLSNRIAVYRTERGWTQQDLADRTDVSRQTIAFVEKNKYNPSLILAFKIARAFGVPLTEVFQYEEDEQDE